MPASPPTRNINKEEIVSSALSIIDEGGLDALNMRALARRLGVYPTAIYWHVKNKDTLLSEVAALVMRDVAPTMDARDWRVWLKLLFRRYRAAVARHPNVSTLIGAHIISNNRPDFGLVHDILSVLSGAGFAGASLIKAYNATVAAMLGFVTVEYAQVAPEAAGEWAAEMRTKLAATGPDNYPLIAANRRALQNKSLILRWQNGVDVPLSSSFDFYVDMTISGLDALRSKSPER